MVTGTILLLVLVRCTVLPDCTLVITVTTSETELVVIKVCDGVKVLVTVLVLVGWSAELVVCADALSGVCVDVMLMTVTEGEEDGGRVTTEEVTVVASEVVSLVTMAEVVESVGEGVGVAEAVAESVVDSVVSVAPVTSDTV